MGRIRTIKPEFHAHEELSSLPAETHLLAAALTNYADDYGYFNANPLLVKAGTNPLRADRTKIEDQLVQLEAIGYITIRRQGVKAIGRIVTFEAHQRVSHPSASKLSDKFEAIAKSSGAAPESLRPEQGTGNREQGKEREALVERVFVSYCAAVGKDSKRYTLTEERRKKTLLRIDERLKIHEGDLGVVEAELVQAVKNLAASEFHRTKGYTDWTEQIFRSQEEFEKRLNWQRPTGDGNGTNQVNHVRGQQRVDQAIDELRKAGVEIPDRRAEESAGEVRAATWGSDGRDPPGIILEGSG